jgi:Ser/Thr protein kinase RdoA (MazF antagonist)
VPRSRATPADAELALGAWDLRRVSVAPLDGGLINDTFAVDSDAGRFVLQRVHPVFAPQVHENIAAVTDRLVERGVATPVLRPTSGGGLWSEQTGGVWRLMTRMPGVSFACARSPAQARAAAALLAGFHGALVDLPHAFVGMRVGVHDTAAHLRALEHAVVEHADHRLHGTVAALAAEILRGAAALPQLHGLPDRIMHGDPKFNNVLFEGEDPIARERPVCLVDLDTTGPGPLHLELGDMWRSWCNLRGEDERQAAFDLGVFDASLRGYASARSAPSDAEREALLWGLEWITLELAARFAADALAERYFGWDAARFPARGEHNLARAQGQWSLHEQVLATREHRRAAIRAAW